MIIHYSGSIKPRGGHLPAWESLPSNNHLCCLAALPLSVHLQVHNTVLLNSHWCNHSTLFWTINPWWVSWHTSGRCLLIICLLSFFLLCTFHNGAGGGRWIIHIISHSCKCFTLVAVKLSSASQVQYFLKKCFTQKPWGFLSLLLKYLTLAGVFMCLSASHSRNSLDL